MFVRAKMFTFRPYLTFAGKARDNIHNITTLIFKKGSNKLTVFVTTKPFQLGLMKHSILLGTFVGYPQRSVVNASPGAPRQPRVLPSVTRKH